MYRNGLQKKKEKKNPLKGNQGEGASRSIRDPMDRNGLERKKKGKKGGIL